MSSEKQSVIVLPHYLMPQNLSDEFWLDPENWRSSCPFPFGNISDALVVRIFKAMVDYSQDADQGSAVKKTPIGLDFATILLARVHDLFRKAWGPRCHKPSTDITHNMVGVALQIPGTGFTQPMRFMMGLVEGKYAPFMLRGGITHGCTTDSTKAKKGYDEEKRKVDYVKYQQYSGVEIGLTKRTVSASYRRIDPTTVKQLLADATTDEERMEIKRNAYLTTYEICSDMQQKRIAAASNVAERQKSTSSNGNVSVDQSKNQIFFPLADQKSICGIEELSDMSKWQTTKYGYLNWDVYLPKCADAPDAETCRLMSLGKGSPIGPVSSYNVDMIILDPAVSAANNARLASRAVLDAPDDVKPEDGNVGKKPFVTRYSRVVSFDPNNPSIPPVLEPIKDLRPYVNLGNDWIVPAMIDQQGPYQLASAKAGWKGKYRAYELIMWDPIFSPMMNAETREAARQIEDAKTVVLPDGNEIYSQIFAPMTTGIENGSACTDLVLSSGESMLFGAFDPIRSADKKRSADQQPADDSEVSRPVKMPLIEDISDVVDEANVATTIRARVIQLLQSSALGMSQDDLLLKLANYDSDDVLSAVTYLLECGDLYGSPENYRA